MRLYVQLVAKSGDGVVLPKLPQAPPCVQAQSSMTKVWDHAKTGPKTVALAGSPEDKMFTHLVEYAKSGLFIPWLETLRFQVVELVEDDARLFTVVRSPLANGMCVCRRCSKQAKQHVCSGCRLVFYCSEACQRSHWKHHRPYCHFMGYFVYVGLARRVGGETDNSAYLHAMLPTDEDAEAFIKSQEAYNPLVKAAAFRLKTSWE